jgi:hypothetical protein
LKNEPAMKTVTTTDGEIFVMPGNNYRMTNDDPDIPGIVDTITHHNFKCPECKQIVTKTFVIDDVDIDETFWNVDLIVNDVMIDTCIQYE